MCTNPISHSRLGHILLPAYYCGRNLAESYYLAIPALELDEHRRRRSVVHVGQALKTVFWFLVRAFCLGWTTPLSSPFAGGGGGKLADQNQKRESQKRETRGERGGGGIVDRGEEGEIERGGG